MLHTSFQDNLSFASLTLNYRIFFDKIKVDNFLLREKNGRTLLKEKKLLQIFDCPAKRDCERGCKLARSEFATKILILNSDSHPASKRQGGSYFRFFFLDLWIEFGKMIEKV